ncbi:MAG: hypothetical protein JXA37_00105, partial [Chloroflexia bacterium]|nr:hypothetical protein [Chloroflexia bacterium]
MSAKKHTLLLIAGLVLLGLFVAACGAQPDDGAPQLTNPPQPQSTQAPQATQAPTETPLPTNTPTPTP